jgi:uncharacterized protein (TIGR02246 family)
MSTATARTAAGKSPEAEVRALHESWLKAVRSRDVDGIVAHYARDIVAFDAIQQLQFKGVDAYKKHWAACMEMCTESTGFEIAQLEIAAADGAAFSHGLLSCGGTDQNGEHKSAWMRVTTGYRKTGGRWIISHEHFSAPFDMASGKAIFDAKP